jgi:hypothetical protein
MKMTKSRPKVIEIRDTKLIISQPILISNMYSTFLFSVNISDLFYKILSGVVVAIVMAILGFFWRRTKRIVAKPIEKILRKTCEQCDGSGLMICPNCEGSGSSIRKVTEIGPCKRCDGTGQIKDRCPECMGAGEKKRTLRYNVEERKTWVYGILWHTQRIAITLRNVDDKAGYFIVKGTIVKDNQTIPSEEKRVFIKAGDKETINIDFPLGWYLLAPPPFEAFYVIEPEVLAFRCGSCQGDKYILKICPVCRGLKTLTETKEITEICSTCNGKGQVTCQTCNGSGKIRRFL